MTRTRIFTIGIALLVTGCASFEPELDSQSTGITTEGDTSDGTDGTDDSSTGSEETEGETEGETDGGTTGDGDGDGDGNPEPNPAPGEPCDPLLAFNGEAPCEDPENPQTLYTCAPTKMSPNETTWDFRCIEVKDTQGNGYDLGDGCDDDFGSWWNDGTPAGCFNAWCLSNGLGNNPDFDEHINWPANECPFDQGGSLVKGCCSSYCDAQNPCQAGWTCANLNTQYINIDTDVGVCVWNG